jgi:PAS domain S-box-containing protein
MSAIVLLQIYGRNPNTRLKGHYSDLVMIDIVLVLTAVAIGLLAAALRRSLLKYHTLIQQQGEGFLVLDSDRRIQMANPAAAEIFGVPAECLRGRLINEFIPAGEWLGGKVVSTECPSVSRTSLELTAQRPDGTQRRLLVTGTPHRREDGTWSGTIGVLRDVTALREADEKMRLMAHALRSTDNCVYITDVRDRFMYVNDAFLNTYGYTESELLGQHIGIVRSARNPAALLEQILPAILKDGWHGELWNRAKSKREFLVSLTASAVRDEHGRVIATVGVARDLTERKRAEEAQRKSESRFRHIAETITEAFWIADAQLDTMFYISPGYERIWGRSTSSLYENPKSFVDAIHEEDRERVIADLRVMREGRPASLEYRVVRPDGEVRWIWDRGFPLREETGQVTQFIGIAQDITERKQAEVALRESNERYRQLADNFPNGTVSIYSKDLRLTFVSGQELMQSGVAAESFVGKHFNELAPPETIRIAEPHLRAALAGQTGTYETSYYDGRHYFVVVTPLTRATGEVQEIMVVSLNITVRKQAQEERAKLQAQLQQAQKMESVGRLAGGVAHDFNNMLSVILGHADLALQQVDRAQPLHDDLMEIRNAAERSADLTRQLLAFARKQTIAPKLMDLNETIAGTLKMLKRIIGENIKLKWLPEVDLWPVSADPSQIDQIMANLCVNARDAISGVGNLTIETRNRTLDENYCSARSYLAPGDYVMLTVRDDGCGMDKETQSHIFEPFFSTKGVGKGTGLGLSMVYGAVKQNNGFIEVSSEPNKGTTFRIYLPRVIAKTEESQQKGPMAANVCGHETVLLVEDESAILKLATRVLEMLGYTVLAASTPIEAIRLARERTGEIHLLMTDVVMPEMNGCDLAKELFALQPGLKCLYMSGYTADVIALNGNLDEGVQFMPKPFSTNELAVAVRKVLERT